jgi:hypothetical protein
MSDKALSDCLEESLKEALSYDPASGEFTWLKGGFGKAKQGEVAGRMLNSGYWQLFFRGKAHSAHRVAFLFVTGDWPSRNVDHIDGNRSNNAWANLRECSTAENHQNRKIPVTNTSGYMGVFLDSGRWRARIRAGGKRISLGFFESRELASQAYLEAKSKLHTFNPIQRSSR